MTNAIEQAHTKSHKVTLLTLDQQRALELVLRGFNDIEVAKALNLRRETICRWRHHDPAFRALIQEQRAEMLEATVERLQDMAEQAATVVLSSLHSPKADPKLAMSLLSSLGMFERRREPGRVTEVPVATSTVSEVEREDEVERQIDAVEAETGGGERQLEVGAGTEAPTAGVGRGSRSRKRGG